MSSQPLLSIIIISFNTRQLTLNCLHSVFADKNLEFDLNKRDSGDKIPTEIIVVDNHSQDDSLSVLKKIKNIKLIANQENYGFGKANNQGLKIAQGNYILFLNSDTLILHSAISQSLNWLASHPEASTCTAQLLNRDKTIQASGGYFPTLANVIAWSFGLDDLPFFNKIIKPLHPHTPSFYTHDSFYLKDHPQDWVTGAFMLIRRSVLNKVGGFDEKYFMYSEEVELSYRIHRAFPQSQTWYLVGPQIIHLGGSSALKKNDPILREYTGIFTFFKLHRPAWQRPIVKFLLKVNAFLRSLYNPLYKDLCSKI